MPENMLFWWNVALTVLFLVLLGVCIYLIIEKDSTSISGNTTTNDFDVIVNLGTQTDDLDMGGNRIMSVGTPLLPTDAVPLSLMDTRLTSIPAQTKDFDLDGHQIKGLRLPSTPTDAVTVSYLQSRMTALPPQTADVAMGGFKITGLADPTTDTDSATMKYVDDTAAAIPPQTADVVMSGFRITGLADPASASDAATKDYVDLYAQGVTYLEEVKTKTSGNLTGTNYAYNNGTGGVGATITADGALGTIGGHAVQQSERILLDQQSDGKHNGIYAATSINPVILTRVTDFDGSPISETRVGTVVLVTHGTFASNRYVLANKNSQLAAPPDVTLGIDVLVWVQQGGTTLSGPLDAIDSAGTLTANQLYVGSLSSGVIQTKFNFTTLVNPSTQSPTGGFWPLTFTNGHVVLDTAGYFDSAISTTTIRNTSGSAKYWLVFGYVRVQSSVNRTVEVSITGNNEVIIHTTNLNIINTAITGIGADNQYSIGGISTLALVPAGDGVKLGLYTSGTVTVQGTTAATRLSIMEIPYQI